MVHCFATPAEELQSFLPVPTRPGKPLSLRGKRIGIREPQASRFLKQIRVPTHALKRQKLAEIATVPRIRMMKSAEKQKNEVNYRPRLVRLQ